MSAQPAPVLMTGAAGLMVVVVVEEEEAVADLAEEEEEEEGDTNVHTGFQQEPVALFIRALSARQLPQNARRSPPLEGLLLLKLSEL
jgi:hypothetical protein